MSQPKIKIKITQSRGAKNYPTPPKDGKCQACNRQTHGYWGARNKQGLFICHYCKQGK
jgi:hypothetical protein